MKTNFKIKIQLSNFLSRKLDALFLEKYSENKNQNYAITHLL